jgi:hypothetical protein
MFTKGGSIRCIHLYSHYAVCNPWSQFSSVFLVFAAISNCNTLYGNAFTFKQINRPGETATVRATCIFSISPSLNYPYVPGSDHCGRAHGIHRYDVGGMKILFTDAPSALWGEELSIYSKQSADVEFIRNLSTRWSTTRATTVMVLKPRSPVPWIRTRNMPLLQDTAVMHRPQIMASAHLIT